MPPGKVRRRSGGVPCETEEMIDLGADRGIGAEVEVFGADVIDQSYERLLARAVRFRFVIDIRTMST